MQNGLSERMKSDVLVPFVPGKEVSPFFRTTAFPIDMEETHHFEVVAQILDQPLGLHQIFDRLANVEAAQAGSPTRRVSVQDNRLDSLDPRVAGLENVPLVDDCLF